jgi:NAD(P)-dependent dehydrogenase (short-subunit alcohol dehydrogenase family)
MDGHTVLITGGSGGLGFEAGSVLAGHGARVVLACRDRRKGTAAAARISGEHRDARVEVLELDLADLASVHRAAEAFLAEHERLDVLLNNAGVMAIPLRKTADGLEMQFGTNHVGHFALTGLLLELLLATPRSRVVNVSSLAHRNGRIDFDNLNAERRYSRMGAYGQSKLANLLFTDELRRRLRRARSSTLAVAAHPGVAATNLFFTSAGIDAPRVIQRLVGMIPSLFSQPAAMGALPLLFAASDPSVRSGHYIGPGGLGEMTGYPVRVEPSTHAKDRRTAARLWNVSEELTGVTYDALRARS